MHATNYQFTANQWHIRCRRFVRSLLIARTDIRYEPVILHHVPPQFVIRQPDGLKYVVLQKKFGIVCGSSLIRERNCDSVSNCRFQSRPRFYKLLILLNRRHCIECISKGNLGFSRKSLNVLRECHLNALFYRYCISLSKHLPWFLV